MVDRKDLFVSSANFTEAAQERNVEVGLLIHSPILAERVQAHFEALVDATLARDCFDGAFAASLETQAVVAVLDLVLLSCR